MRLNVPAAALALATSLGTAAAEPPPGIPGNNEGTATLLLGARSIPQGGFLDDQAAAGFRPWKTLVSPGGVLSLGYAPEPDFHVKINFGYGWNDIHMTPGTLTSKSFTILLGADAPFFRRSWITLYGGGGIGYSLNTLTQAGNSGEANSPAGYVALGARFPIAKNFALVVEDRYTLAFATLPPPGNPLVYGGTASSLNVGGNLLSIGIMFHSVDSDEGKRPLHP